MPHGPHSDSEPSAWLWPRSRGAKAIAVGWVALALVAVASRLFGVPDHLTASYWANESWSGAAALTRTEGSAHTDRETLRRLVGESPAYSVEWTGVVFVPRAGEYILTTTSDDGSWVFVDGEAVIDNGGRHGAVTGRARVRLSQGLHALTIRYFDGGGLAEMEFSWRATGAVRRGFPAGVIYPSAPGGRDALLDWILAIVRTMTQWLLLLVTAVLLAGVAMRLAPRRREAVLAASAFATVFVVCSLYLVERRSTAVTACDTYAYLQGATAMAAQGPLHSELHDPLVPRIVQSFETRPTDRDLAFFLSPHGHYVADFSQGTSRNVFPPGMMWLLLPLVELGRPWWALLLLPVLTITFALTFFLLARRHVGVWCAACAASFVICSPVVFENTVLLMSDVPAMALASAAVYLLFLNLARARPALPLLAGACFGVALTVRYSSAAAVVPVVFILAVEWARRRRFGPVLRDAALFGTTGTLTGLLPLGLYAWTQYGTPWRLTYDPYTASHMSTSHLVANLSFYAHSLVHSFGVAGLAVAAIGFIFCVAQRRWRLFAFAALLTFAAFLVPYAFERLREHRYLMPVYPWLGLLYGFGAVSLGSLLGKARLLRRLAIPSGVLALLVMAPFVSGRGRFLSQGEHASEPTSMRLAARIEPDAVVMCDHLSGPLRLYASITTYRFAWTRGETLAQVCETLAEWGRPVYFLLDGDAATDHFRRLRETAALPVGRLVPEGDVDGLPLWRYVVRR